MRLGLGLGLALGLGLVIGGTLSRYYYAAASLHVNDSRKNTYVLILITNFHLSDKIFSHCLCNENIIPF